MWPFKRGGTTDNQSDVPAEIQEYYQSSQRERRWVAWALAAVTLVVTVGVVLGLFFGGRAIYRKVHKNKPVATTTQPSSGTSSNTSKPQSGGSSSPSQPKSAGNSSSSSGVVATPDDSTSKNVSVGTSPATPKVTPPNTPAPNTGPGETAAVGFVGASFTGFVLYEWRLRRKVLR